MADRQQYELLWQETELWNTWRQQQQPGFRPDLSGADLGGANLSFADLSFADLGGAILSRAHLSFADLSDAQLSRAILSEANLIGAILSRANLNDSDLGGANLSGADLSFVNLNDADLREANLSFTHLNGAYLRNAFLRRVDLSGADLTGAIFSEAYLSGANLKGATLSGTYLTDANLTALDFSRADLSRASVGLTIFGGLDLRTVKGLETVTHVTPSTIDTDTILRSQGDIPEVFLRRAGLSEDIIMYAHSLAQHPNQYYTSFLSYSSKDQDFAERLYADLQSKGVHCWFAPEDMKIGDKVRHRVDESIRLYDKLLLVLSEHSVTSQWVEQEVETALAREREGQPQVLFPIRLDESIMQITSGWPALIRNTRHIGDFTRWKQHDDYQQALERLLRDLKAEAQT